MIVTSEFNPYASTDRTTRLPVSTKYNIPLVDSQIPFGEESAVCHPGKPSTPFPLAPVPTTVEIVYFPGPAGVEYFNNNVRKINALPKKENIILFKKNLQ